jgi:N-acyl homoserine lactone hydrolase
LFIISTQGHTNGHLSFLINTDKGPILIVGAACDLKIGWQNNIEPGMATNRSEAQKSLQRLKNFANKYPQVRVVIGHDPSENYNL